MMECKITEEKPGPSGGSDLIIITPDELAKLGLFQNLQTNVEQSEEKNTSTESAESIKLKVKGNKKISLNQRRGVSEKNSFKSKILGEPPGRLTQKILNSEVTIVSESVERPGENRIVGEIKSQSVLNSKFSNKSQVKSSPINKNKQPPKKNVVPPLNAPNLNPLNNQQKILNNELKFKQRKFVVAQKKVDQQKPVVVNPQHMSSNKYTEMSKVYHAEMGSKNILSAKAKSIKSVDITNIKNISTKDSDRKSSKYSLPQQKYTSLEETLRRGLSRVLQKDINEASSTQPPILIEDDNGELDAPSTSASLGKILKEGVVVSSTPARNKNLGVIENIDEPSAEVVNIEHSKNPIEQIALPKNAKKEVIIISNTSVQFSNEVLKHLVSKPKFTIQNSTKKMSSTENISCVTQSPLPVEMETDFILPETEASNVTTRICTETEKPDSSQNVSGKVEEIDIKGEREDTHEIANTLLALSSIRENNATIEDSKKNDATKREMHSPQISSHDSDKKNSFPITVNERIVGDHNVLVKIEEVDIKVEQDDMNENADILLTHSSVFEKNSTSEISKKNYPTTREMHVPQISSHRSEKITEANINEKIVTNRKPPLKLLALSKLVSAIKADRDKKVIQSEKVSDVGQSGRELKKETFKSPQDRNETDRVDGKNTVRYIGKILSTSSDKDKVKHFLPSSSKVVEGPEHGRQVRDSDQKCETKTISKREVELKNTKNRSNDLKKSTLLKGTNINMKLDKRKLNSKESGRENPRKNLHMSSDIHIVDDEEEKKHINKVSCENVDLTIESESNDNELTTIPKKRKNILRKSNVNIDDRKNPLKVDRLETVIDGKKKKTQVTHSTNDKILENRDSWVQTPKTYGRQQKIKAYDKTSITEEGSKLETNKTSETSKVNSSVGNIEIVSKRKGRLRRSTFFIIDEKPGDSVTTSKDDTKTPDDVEKNLSNASEDCKAYLNKEPDNFENRNTSSHIDEDSARVKLKDNIMSKKSSLIGLENPQAGTSKAEIDTSLKQPRKRGRPKKVVKGIQEENEHLEIRPEETISTPLPKKRGRKRRLEIIESTIEEIIEPIILDQSRSGRKRKKVDYFQMENSVTNEEAGQRKRRRKTSVQVADSVVEFPKPNKTKSNTSMSTGDEKEDSSQIISEVNEPEENVKQKDEGELKEYVEDSGKIDAQIETEQENMEENVNAPTVNSNEYESGEDLQEKDENDAQKTTKQENIKETASAPTVNSNECGEDLQEKDENDAEKETKQENMEETVSAPVVNSNECESGEDLQEKDKNDAQKETKQENMEETVCAPAVNSNKCESGEDLQEKDENDAQKETKQENMKETAGAPTVNSNNSESGEDLQEKDENDAQKETKQEDMRETANEPMVNSNECESEENLKEKDKNNTKSNGADNSKEEKQTKSGNKNTIRLINSMFTAAIINKSRNDPGNKEKETESPNIITSMCDRRKKKTESNIVIDGNNMVTCTSCKNKINNDEWDDHNINVHYCLAWREGDLELNLDDTAFVTKTLTPILKQKKELKCNKCGRRLTTVNGFITHIEKCNEIVSSGGSVTCAVCKLEMEKNKWQFHKLKKHNNLAWRIGDHPLNLNDKTLVLGILNALYKAKKPLICEKCGTTKKSVLGFLSHQAQCGLEIDDAKIKCELCDRKVLPVSMPSHLKFFHETPKIKDVEQTSDYFNVDRDAPLKKRQAAKRAMLVMDQLSKENIVQEYAQHYLKNVEFKEEKFVIPLLRNEVLNDDRIKCKFNSCIFETDEATTLVDHMESCEHKPDQYYTCKKCLVICDTEEEIKKHIKDVHNIDLIKDYLSSDNDNEEDEDSEEEDEEESYSRKKKRRDKAKQERFGITRRRHAHLYDIGQKKPGTLFSKAFKFTIEFCKEFLSEPLLFDNLRYWDSDWSTVHEDHVQKYLPKYLESCDVAWTKGNTFNEVIGKDYTFKKFEIFETNIEDGIATIFCGGPITAMAWMPTPYTSFKSKQILAVAPAKCFEKEYLCNKWYNEESLIQFWSFGVLRNNQQMAEPTLHFSLAVDFGPIWHLEWCPSGCYDSTEDNGQEKPLARMGLLAAAGSDGVVYIYSIPFLYEEDVGTILEVKPLLKLFLVPRNSKGIHHEEFYATKISWSKGHGHKYAAVGYTDGLVALYDISTTSELLMDKDFDGVDIIKPIKIFPAHYHYISALHLLEHGDGKSWLLTGSFDRDVFFWDLTNGSKESTAIVGKKFIVTDGVWLTNWLSYVVTYDTSTTSCAVSASLRSCREHMCDRVNLTYSNITINSISASDWLNGIIQGNAVGEVVAAFPQSLFSVESDKNLKSYRYFLGCVKLINKHKSPTERVAEEKAIHKALNTSSTGGSPESPNKIYKLGDPMTYSSGSAKYGVVFCDKKMDKISDFLTSDKQQKYDVEPESYKPQIYPMRAVNKVAFNPNLQASLYYAAGYQCGFVRVSYLKFWEGDLHLNKWE